MPQRKVGWCFFLFNTQLAARRELAIGVDWLDCLFLSHRSVQAQEQKRDIKLFLHAFHGNSFPGSGSGVWNNTWICYSLILQLAANLFTVSLSHAISIHPLLLQCSCGICRNVELKHKQGTSVLWKWGLKCASSQGLLCPRNFCYWLHWFHHLIISPSIVTYS